MLLMHESWGGGGGGGLLNSEKINKIIAQFSESYTLELTFILCPTMRTYVRTYVHVCNVRL